MKYLDLKTNLDCFTVFSLQDISKIDSGFHRRRLNDWQEKGYIKKVIRGYYIFSDQKIDEYTLFSIANRIYYPSYISFEMALSYHNLIPEGVYSLTSASTRKTYEFNTTIAKFNYHTIKKELFFGYELSDINGKQYKIASVEKAILDYFYINTRLESEDDFKGMRINQEVFRESVKVRRLNEYLEKFSQKTLRRRIMLFMEYMRNA